MNNNPFTATLAIPFLRVIKRDVTDYKIVKGMDKSDYFDVDKVPSTRVFRGTAHLNEVMKMSASCVKLYFYLILKVQKSELFIRIDDKTICKLFECSERQAARLRAELIKFTIIAKKENNQYWINPRFFCSGDRLKMYSECAVLSYTIKEDKYFSNNNYQDEEANIS